LMVLTGGGAQFTPRSTESLIATLREVLADPEKAREMGARGASGVRNHFAADRMVAETEAEYLRLLGG